MIAMHINGSIEYPGAQGTAASEACQSTKQYAAAVAQLPRQHVARGHALEDQHGHVGARERRGARLATYRFVE